MEDITNKTKAPPLRFSSGYPYFQIIANTSAPHATAETITSNWHNHLYFFPKPLIRFPFSPSAQQMVEASPKLLKKIQFISHTVLHRLQTGKSIAFSPNHIINQQFLLADEDLTLTPAYGDCTPLLIEFYL